MFEKIKIDDMVGTYRVIDLRKRVSLKVPVLEAEEKTKYTSNGHHMKLNNGGENIPKHWHHGMKIPLAKKTEGKKFGLKFRILNRHYFNISQSDLGEKITATVIILWGKTQRGYENIMLNIIKEPKGTLPLYELKYPNNGKGLIPIPDTNTKLWFRRIKKPKK